MVVCEETDNAIVDVAGLAYSVILAISARLSNDTAYTPLLPSTCKFPSSRLWETGSQEGPSSGQNSECDCSLTAIGGTV